MSYSILSSNTATHHSTERFGSEQVPLQNIEAEEAVLGAILLDPAAITTALSLSSEAFSLTAHQTIFRAALTLHEQGKPTDLMHVTTWLNDRKRLAEIGGRSKLVTLVERTVSVATIKSDIDLVLDKYQLRLKQSIGNDLAAGRISSEEAMKRLEEISTGKKSDGRVERIKAEIRELAKVADSTEYKMKLADICRKTGFSKRDVEGEILTLTSKTENRKVEVVSLKEFYAEEMSAVRWLFSGLIPRTGVSLWCGDPGSGKTTLAIDAVGSLVLNEEFLGEMPTTKKGRALIVAADENPAYTREKLIERGIAEHAEIAIIKNWDISKWSDLEETVASFKPDLIVIDCFASIHHDATFDENSSLAKMTVYRLERLSDAYSSAIILLHHLNKNPDAKGLSKIRGSSAIAGACSAVGIFEKTASGDARHMTFPKMRGAEASQMTMELDRLTGRYILRAGGQDESTKNLIQQLLEFFKSSADKRFEFSEIKNAIVAEAESIRKALGRLVNRGQIARQKSKVDGRFNVWGFLDPSPSPSPSEVVCLIPEIQSEQELQVLDRYWTGTGQVLDNPPCPIPCPISETLSVQGLEQVLDNTGQELGGEGSPPLSSTELKWLLQLLSDMEHSREIGAAHPRFTSSDHVVQQYNKAERKAALCMEQLLSTCSDYWERLSNATASLFELLAETEVTDQLYQPGES